jgi:hypothetical protein
MAFRAVWHCELRWWPTHYRNDRSWAA